MSNLPQVICPRVAGMRDIKILRASILLTGRPGLGERVLYLDTFLKFLILNGTIKIVGTYI